MTLASRFQLLTCLLVYAGYTHAIMVKFGTKDGPIEPPAPTPVVPPAKPYRAPAPVWEERANDSPDPNADWRPPSFVPSPRYTQVVVNQPGSQSYNSAKQFVNAYRPRQPEPIAAQSVQQYFRPQQYVVPSEIVSHLSSQSLPGIGLRYFVPYFVNDGLEKQEKKKRQDDGRYNELETNQVDTQGHASDLQWKSEKEAATRSIKKRTSDEASARYVYEWPVFVPRRH